MPCALLVDNMVISSGSRLSLFTMAPLAVYTTFHSRWLVKKQNMIMNAADNSPPIFVNCSTNKGANRGGPIKNHERYFPPNFSVAF